MRFLRARYVITHLAHRGTSTLCHTHTFATSTHSLFHTHTHPLLPHHHTHSPPVHSFSHHHIHPSTHCHIAAPIRTLPHPRTQCYITTSIHPPTVTSPHPYAHQPCQVCQFGTALFITSTFEDGGCPRNAIKFFEELEKLPEDSLQGTSFSVCGLGSRVYVNFCAAAIKLYRSCLGL
jgi:hypothetical protein